MIFNAEISSLDQTIAIYDNSLSKLNENMNSLKRSLSDLQSDSWKGKSKEEFMSVKYGDWEKGVREHISRLEFLTKMLKEARNEINTAKDEGNRLSV